MPHQDDKYILLLFNNVTLLTHILIIVFHFYAIYIDMPYIFHHANPIANYIFLFGARFGFSFFLFVNGYRLAHTCFKKVSFEQWNIGKFLKIFTKIFTKNLLTYYGCLLGYHFVYNYLNLYPENETISHNCEITLFHKLSLLSKLFGNSRLCQGMFWTYSVVMQYMLLFPLIIIGIKWYE